MSGPGSWRRAPLPPDWETRIRPAVLKRDGYACQWRITPGQLCLAHANQADHIDPDGGDGMGNLQALCQAHHSVKTGREAGRASGALRTRIAAARPRPRDPHPGLLRKEAS